MPRYPKDITGLRLGYLTAVRFVRYIDHGHSTWIWRCDCGREKELVRANVTATRGTRSCGCGIIGYQSGKFHGQAKPFKTREYEIWQSMKKRCNDPGCKGYKRYGARGIRVCDEWNDSFQAFLSHMGPCPGPEYSIDRIDNDGNYEPGNCRWADRETQASNRSTNVFLEHSGQRMTMKQWSRAVGISNATLCGRLRRGWSVDKALTTPAKPRAAGGHG